MKLFCLSFLNRPRSKGARHGPQEKHVPRVENVPSKSIRKQDEDIITHDSGLTPQNSSHSSQSGVPIPAGEVLSSTKPQIVVSKSSETDLQQQTRGQPTPRTSLLAVPRAQQRTSARNLGGVTHKSPGRLTPRPEPSVERLSNRRSLQDEFPGPVAAQSLTIDVSPRQPDVNHPTTELQNLLTKYRKDMLSAYSSPSEVNELDLRQDNYITLRKLREIFPEIELDHFLSRFKWYRQNLLAQIRNDYLCIIATLIDIGWEEWEQFHRHFLHHHVSPTTLNVRRRNDMSLPFTRDELNFLSFTTQRAFFPSQFKFKHETLTQGVDYPDELLYQTRLPFRTKTPLWRSDIEGTSNSRPIFRVEIDQYGMKIRDVPYVDVDNPVVAMKVFANKLEFDQEVSAQTKIKEHVSYHEHIVISLTSFSHRGSSCILYPWADCDLHSLCFGIFPGFSTMAEGAFRPRLIVEQLKGITQGLYDLHVTYGLRHYDLKLENLFAFLPNSDGLIVVMSNNKIGLWKIGDFGLAKARELKSRGKQPELTGLEAERSGNSAPRSEGTYQAPEMHDGSNVNSSSDNYSLGCIFAVCYVFAIGGPAKVIEFHRQRRKGYSSDQFFTISIDGTYIIKPEIITFLQELTPQDDRSSTTWRAIFIRCILDLIPCNAEGRINAKEAVQRLETVLERLPDCDQLWEYAPSTSEGHPVSQPSHTTQASSPTVPVERSSPSPRLSFPGRTRDQIESTISATSRKIRGAVRRSLHGTRPARQIPHFPPPKCEIMSLFTRLDLIGKIFDVAISPQWIGFVAHDWVKIYDLEQLAVQYRLWQESPLADEQYAAGELVPTALGVECFEDSDGNRDQEFHSVRLAGPFVALLKKYKATPDDRVVEIKRLEWSEEKSQILEQSLTHRNVPAGCNNLVLSVQGAVAFVHSDHVGLLFRVNYDGEPSRGGQLKNKAKISFPGVIRSVAFSDDGSFLCVWYVADRQNWHVYKINNNDGTVSRECYGGEDCWRWADLTPRQRREQQPSRGDPQQMIMVSAAEVNHEFPFFYALDEDRQIWLITSGGNQMIQPSGKYCVGSQFAASLPKNGILTATHAPDGLEIGVAAGLPGPSIQDQPYVETMAEWKQYKAAGTADVKGLTRLCVMQQEAFAVVHLDGSLALHFCK